MKYLISACLCGVPCRYDGTAKNIPELADLVASGRAVLICPETEGGLPVPRPPCEIRNGRVMSVDGIDYTAAYTQGAQAALSLVQKHGVRAAILKERSPSCGTRMIYDGTFSGRRVRGMGLTAELLAEHGVRLYSEEHLPAAILVPHT